MPHYLAQLCLIIFGQRLQVPTRKRGAPSNGHAFEVRDGYDGGPNGRTQSPASALEQVKAENRAEAQTLFTKQNLKGEGVKMTHAKGKTTQSRHTGEGGEDGGEDRFEVGRGRAVTAAPSFEMQSLTPIDHHDDEGGPSCDLLYFAPSWKSSIVDTALPPASFLPLAFHPSLYLRTQIDVCCYLCEVDHVWRCIVR